MSPSRRGWARDFLAQCATGSALLGALLLPAIGVAESRFPDYVVFLTAPYFSENHVELGLGVESYYNLQIWPTLRKTDGRKLFGHGLVDDAEEFSPPKTHEEAESIATKKNKLGVVAQIILWGSVEPYGDDKALVATSYVTLPGLRDARPSHPEIWEFKKTIGARAFAFRVDLPSRRYEFQPIIFKSKAVAYYSSDEWRAMRERPSVDAKVVERADDIVTADQIRGDWVLAHNKSETNTPHWIHLPPLGQTKDPVVSFCAGLIRLFRGDWGGAGSLLEEVSQNSDVPTKVRRDALMFRLMANARMDARPSRKKNIDVISAALYQQAKRLDPDSPTVTKYELMRNLSLLPDMVQQSPGIEGILSTISILVSDMVRENAADDELTVTTKAFLDTIGYGRSANYISIKKLSKADLVSVNALPFLSLEVSGNVAHLGPEQKVVVLVRPAGGNPWHVYPASPNSSTREWKVKVLAGDKLSHVKSGDRIELMAVMTGALELPQTTFDPDVLAGFVAKTSVTEMIVKF